MCRCGHPVWFHDVDPEDKCSRSGCGCTAFVPADAETAELECTCIREGGCCHGPGVCLHGCAEAADELSGEHREPEAPECEHSNSSQVNTWDRERLTYQCRDCGATWEQTAEEKDQRSREALIKAREASRRPPYAVAYALASGELYEVALPGDAVATVEHGVLKISHPQGVAHIVQIRPMEGA